MLKAISAVFAVVTLASCAPAEPWSPPRPAGLPPEAVYAGGVDGGDWVACEGTGEGVLYCRTFDPRDGALRRESWFRFCPQLGGRHAGEPGMIDAENMWLGNVRLRRDVAHLPANATAEEIAHEQELIEKYYLLDAVRADCTPMSDEPVAH